MPKLGATVELKNSVLRGKVVPTVVDSETTDSSVTVLWEGEDYPVTVDVSDLKVIVSPT